MVEEVRWRVPRRVRHVRNWSSAIALVLVGGAGAATGVSARDGWQRGTEMPPELMVITFVLIAATWAVATGAWVTEAALTSAADYMRAVVRHEIGRVVARTDTGVIDDLHRTIRMIFKEEVKTIYNDGARAGLFAHQNALQKAVGDDDTTPIQPLRAVGRVTPMATVTHLMERDTGDIRKGRKQ